MGADDYCDKRLHGCTPCNQQCELCKNAEGCVAHGLAHPCEACAVQASYEEVIADHNRLVRELDVLLNGEAGAAKQASLCDIVSQVERYGMLPMVLAEKRKAVDIALDFLVQAGHIGRETAFQVRDAAEECYRKPSRPFGAEPQDYDYSSLIPDPLTGSTLVTDAPGNAWRSGVACIRSVSTQCTYPNCACAATKEA